MDFTSYVLDSEQIIFALNDLKLQVLHVKNMCTDITSALHAFGDVKEHVKNVLPNVQVFAGHTTAIEDCHVRDTNVDASQFLATPAKCVAPVSFLLSENVKFSTSCGYDHNLMSSSEKSASPNSGTAGSSVLVRTATSSLPQTGEKSLPAPFNRALPAVATHQVTEPGVVHRENGKLGSKLKIYSPKTKNFGTFSPNNIFSSSPTSHNSSSSSKMSFSSSSSSKSTNSNSSSLKTNKTGDKNPDFVFSHHLFDGEKFLESSTVEVLSSLKRKEDRPFTIDSSESEEESVVVLGTNDGPNKKLKLGWDVAQANKMAPEDRGTVQVATSSSRGPSSLQIVGELCALAQEEPLFVPRMTAPYRECHPSKHNCFRCVNHPPPGVNQELLSQALASVSRLEKQAALEMELLVKLANTIERLESTFP
jgi:hypothetical protein